MVGLTPQDHARVTAAVTAAEACTRAEIAVLVAPRSDTYRDVALHWAVVAMLGVLAALATWPGVALTLHALVAGPWPDAPAPRTLFTTALIAAALAFLLARALLANDRLRLALTPAATRTRRVRRAALAHFRGQVEGRTTARAGVLLYLSLAERQAEIIADAGLHAAADPALWTEAMADLLDPVRDGRAGDGLAAAVTRIGAVLAAHFPGGEGDVNELPDRLVEL